MALVVDIEGIIINFSECLHWKGWGCWGPPRWNGCRGSGHAWFELLPLHLKASFGRRGGEGGGGGCFLVAHSASPTFRHAIWKSTALHPCYHGFSYSVIHGLRLNNKRWWKKKKNTPLSVSLSLSLSVFVSLNCCLTPIELKHLSASAKSIISGEKSLKCHLIFNNANANRKWLADPY